MNPLLIEVPASFQTERLLLRAPLPGDGRLVNEAICESLPELKPWMSWAQEYPTLEDSEAYVRQSCVDWLARVELQFFGFYKSELVLAIELHGIDWRVPRFEIGYWMRTSALGQGFMTEAVKGITAFAFDALGARRVQIRCNARNEASRRVAARADFPLESIMKSSHRKADGTLQDVCVFALTREDTP